MKHLFWQLLLVVSLLTAVLLCVSASAEATVVASGDCSLTPNYDYLTWTLDNTGTLTISGTGRMNNYGTSSAPWNNYRDDIISVEITASAENVGSYAFYDCCNLKYVRISDRITIIGDHAFYNCNSLPEITISENVKIIGDEAFGNCAALTLYVYSRSYAEQYCIENGNLNFESILQKSVCGTGITGVLNSAGVLRISGTGNIWDYDNGNFYSPWRNKSNIVFVEIGSGITGIGDYTFYGCTGLTRITIPASVTDIGDSVFLGCYPDLTITCACDSYAKEYADDKGIPTALTHSYVEGICSGCGAEEHITGGEGTVTIVDQGDCGDQGNNVTYTLYSDGSLVISGKGAMADYENASLVPWYTSRGSVASVEIESGVTRVGDMAFYDCGNLTSVSIPNTVTAIGEAAFGYDGKLSGIEIPESVRTIGSFAFEYCGALTEVTLPDEIMSVEESLFYSCRNLKKVTIPYGVTDFGRSAFFNCESLTDVNIPASVRVIGNSVFGNCKSLTEITIPNGVTSLGKDVFRGCAGLTSVTIPDSVESIGEFAFDGCGDALTITCGCKSYAKTYADGKGIATSVQHGEIISVEAVEPTCEVPGYTAGTKCSACEAVFSGCEPVDPLGHDLIPHEAQAPKCEAVGWDVYDTCSRCEYTTYKEIPKLGHDLIPHEAQKPTCEAVGWDAYDTCSRCDYTTYKEIPATGHTEVADPYVAPTRTTYGKTAGSHCGVCGKILVEQKLIAPLTDGPIVALPGAVIEIAEEAYLGSAVEIVILPETCTTIGSKAFANCASLKLIEIPAGVTEIAADAFDNSPNVVIVTTANSPAAAFAETNGIDCLIRNRKISE